MTNKFFQLVTLSFVLLAFVSGCATAKPRRAESIDTAAQVTQLQSELQAKDQQIEDLQYQLESYGRSMGSSGSFSSGKSSLIRVSGVTVKDVQKALKRAGYDPGPVDGQAGKKTKSAIKQFQRKNDLKADGIIGEKTWSLLRS